MPPLIDALRADGWIVWQVASHRGVPYYRAWRDGLQRGAYSLESLARLCQEAPAPSRPVQMELALEAA